MLSASNIYQSRRYLMSFLSLSRSLLCLSVSLANLVCSLLLLLSSGSANCDIVESVEHGFGEAEDVEKVLRNNFERFLALYLGVIFLSGRGSGTDAGRASNRGFSVKTRTFFLSFVVLVNWRRVSECVCVCVWMRFPFWLCVDL